MSKENTESNSTKKRVNFFLLSTTKLNKLWTLRVFICLFFPRSHFFPSFQWNNPFLYFFPVCFAHRKKGLCIIKSEANFNWIWTERIKISWLLIFISWVKKWFCMQCYCTCECECNGQFWFKKHDICLRISTFTARKKIWQRNAHDAAASFMDASECGKVISFLHLLYFNFEKISKFKLQKVFVRFYAERKVGIERESCKAKQKSRRNCVEPNRMKLACISCWLTLAFVMFLSYANTQRFYQFNVLPSALCSAINKRCAQKLATTTL